MPIFRAYQQHLEWGGDFPEEAQPFFSPAFLWTRPQETAIVQTKVFEAFCDYLQAYLDFVAVAQPVTDRQKLAEILAAQRRYIDYRAAKDPARGMFTRLYGEEWTEEYISKMKKVEGAFYVIAKVRICVELPTLKKDNQFHEITLVCEQEGLGIDPGGDWGIDPITAIPKYYDDKKG